MTKCRISVHLSITVNRVEMKAVLDWYYSFSWTLMERERYIRTQTLNWCLCEIKFVKVCVNKIEFMNKFQSFLLIQEYEIKELLFKNYDISNIITIYFKCILFIILSCFTLFWSRPICIYVKVLHKQLFISSYYYICYELKIRGLCHL